ncbi:STM4015 family protein [Actinomadura miaoliensis]|uniref:Leucine-rich repeat domain-containing protein n=1 Tax=Actinomadura miaoliensis TaxID=430685 RepID=A0ABP7VTU6_9ACTN
MSFDEHLTEFAGLPVVAFTPDTEPDEPLPPAGEAAWAVRGDWNDEPYPRLFERFMAAVDTTRVTALVIGFWGWDDAAGLGAATLTAAADRFPNLRALFLGDILDEEYHLSWIPHADITPLVEAFPRLERLEVRGGDGLELRAPRSDALKVLRFESGGLPSGVVRAVAAGDLPALEELDLWFGVRNYGGDATVDDLAPIFEGTRLPALRHLGLQNGEFQDDIAAALASAPVVARLESLALGMGMLSDRGAEALLSGQPLTHLERLDLGFHYLSEPMMERLRAALPGVEIDLDHPQGQPSEPWQPWQGFLFVQVTE